MRGAASWSGGKDSCFACYKAIQKGFDVSVLLTFGTDGPFFKESREIVETEKTTYDGYGQLNIEQFKISPKKKVGVKE